MLQKLFGFDPTKNKLKTEIIAGITTFLTMAYILAVNPSMFTACGMPAGSVFTATALAAITGTLIMSLWAKLPFALAPGMGLNAFFVFTVCLGLGHSWQFALTAILIEGLIFVILTLTNLREAIVNAIPASLKNAIGAGIGLFIAFIGLQNAGVIVKNDATLVSLGDITSGAPMLAMIGLIITGVFIAKNVKGGLLWGILITAIIGIPMGLTHYSGIMSVPDSLDPIFMKFEWDRILSLDMVVIVFTFLFIDMFDTIGTLVGVSTKANMLTPEGKIPRVKEAFMADAIATCAGACYGTSTTTTYVESAAGVAQGGRTGLTSFVVAVCFTIALLFSPLFLSIPAAATSPVLIIVGLFMLSPIKNIDLDDFSESIPAFVCIVMMPLAYSISDGILLGMICYVVLNVLCGNFKKITITMYVLAIIFMLKYIFI
ncbi:NCS2 family permease [Phocaeicola paurosaccharolyticus]|jgi:adenine/guanine/hypoxanthine permease|uniref:NCS2 family permease n=1 Tax=Phocaeicola paurosaccharolyticus TaxID=732242 RepID=UPI00046A34B4|nr:NCS2 family permease [Phocaeicola paurosaccharolyticus]